MTDRRWTDLLAAAISLREAQKAYMADRGNEKLGRAVGARAKELDDAIEAANQIGHSKTLEEEERGSRAVSAAGITTAGAAGVL